MFDFFLFIPNKAKTFHLKKRSLNSFPGVLHSPQLCPMRPQGGWYEEPCSVFSTSREQWVRLVLPSLWNGYELINHGCGGGEGGGVLVSCRPFIKWPPDQEWKNQQDLWLPGTSPPGGCVVIFVVYHLKRGQVCDCFIFINITGTDDDYDYYDNLVDKSTMLTAIMMMIPLIPIRITLIKRMIIHVFMIMVKTTNIMVMIPMMIMMISRWLLWDWRMYKCTVHLYKFVFICVYNVNPQRFR
jgi:hypothetical protein